MTGRGRRWEPSTATVRCDLESIRNYVNSLTRRAAENPEGVAYAYFEVERLEDALEVWVSPGKRFHCTVTVHSQQRPTAAGLERAERITPDEWNINFSEPTGEIPASIFSALRTVYGCHPGREIDVLETWT